MENFDDGSRDAFLDEQYNDSLRYGDDEDKTIDGLSGKEEAEALKAIDSEPKIKVETTYTISYGDKEEVYTAVTNSTSIDSVFDIHMEAEGKVERVVRKYYDDITTEGQEPR
jgi:hypothetical protein